MSNIDKIKICRHFTINIDLTDTSKQLLFLILIQHKNGLNEPFFIILSG